MCLSEDTTLSTGTTEEGGGVVRSTVSVCTGTCLYLEQIDVQRYAAYRIKACDEDNGSHCRMSNDVADSECVVSGTGNKALESR